MYITIKRIVNLLKYGCSEVCLSLPENGVLTPKHVEVILI